MVDESRFEGGGWFRAGAESIALPGNMSLLLYSPFTCKYVLVCVCAYIHTCDTHMYLK